MVPAPGAGSPPDDGPPTTTDGSSPFQRHVSRVIDRLDDLWPFAVVPLIVSLLEFEKVGRALGPAGSGFSINLELLFPSPLVTLWRFAKPPDPPRVTTRSPRDEPFGSSSFGESTPSGGSSTPTGSIGSGATDLTIETPVGPLEIPFEAIGPETIAWIGLVLAVYAVLSGILLAGYLGGIDRRLRGEPIAIGSCLVAYAPRLVLYNLVVSGAFLLGVSIVFLVPLLFLLAVPVIVLLGYVFYPVPFLFVVDDAPFRAAFRQSVRLTTAGGPVLSFALWHLAVGIVSSLVLSLFVSAGGAGFLLALIGSAPLGLVLTAATISFLWEFLESDRPESTGRPRNGRPGTDETDEYGWASD
ncbi:hypothetical protein [Natrinema longum]|uniref:Uncharacterized protein n=1 Tax=Natrinema longum TaxID=370324 RepID=A0A8A2U5H0_9EURY|nr:hypothetical protein [Natrinema longum]MBZ6494704.1 hypothetical protein [Natrinema longum]QSW83984.1 hypothetical protein J0X27_10970 [Natrinema longum]